MLDKLAIAIVLGACCASVAQAQSPASAPLEMEQVHFLLGQWRGQGWVIGADGQRHTFHQSESLDLRADGAVVVVEGTGKSNDPADYGQIVHRAFGVLSHDDIAGTFRWYAVRGGQQIDTLAEIGECSLIWSAPDGRGGRVRYTIDILDHRRWHEIGEWSEDGSNWEQVFETTLDRVF